MRKVVVALLVAVSLAALCVAAPARAQMVDIGFFHEQLAPFGEWVQHAEFGWVWIPSDVAVGWRPYTNGHWVYTNEGPAWVANEEWGWIPFHYGRWAFDVELGWFWVPDTVWAPSWVAWRSGGGFVGWAPLPPPFRPGPRGFVSVGFGFGDIFDDWWVFVPQQLCLAPQILPVVVIPARNPIVIRNTVIIRNNVQIINNRVIDRTIGPDLFRRWTGRAPITIRTIDIPRDPGGRRFEIQGNSLQIFRPPVLQKSPGPPQNRPLGERRTFPGGFAAEKELMIQRYQTQSQELRNLQQREMEASPKRRDVLIFRNQIERNRMEDWRNRDMRQFERRYPGKGIEIR